MGNRLSKIYTRTGDAGTTGLGDGKRVSKNSLRIHALGEVDETNAIVGLLLCEEMPDDVRSLLTKFGMQRTSDIVRVLRQGQSLWAGAAPGSRSSRSGHLS